MIMITVRIEQRVDVAGGLECSSGRLGLGSDVARSGTPDR